MTTNLSISICITTQSRKCVTQHPPPLQLPPNTLSTLNKAAVDIATLATPMAVAEELAMQGMGQEAVDRKGHRNVIFRVGGDRGGMEVVIIMVLEGEGVGEVAVGMVGIQAMVVRVILRGRSW